MSNYDYETNTVQSVQDFKQSQALLPLWVSKALTGLAGTDLVQVRRKHTLFGTYVLTVTQAKERNYSVGQH